MNNISKEIEELELDSCAFFDSHEQVQARAHGTFKLAGLSDRVSLTGANWSATKLWRKKETLFTTGPKRP